MDLSFRLPNRFAIHTYAHSLFWLHGVHHTNRTRTIQTSLSSCCSVMMDISILFSPAPVDCRVISYSYGYDCGLIQSPLDFMAQSPPTTVLLWKYPVYQFQTPPWFHDHHGWLLRSSMPLLLWWSSSLFRLILWASLCVVHCEVTRKVCAMGNPDMCGTDNGKCKHPFGYIDRRDDLCLQSLPMCAMDR